MTKWIISGLVTLGFVGIGSPLFGADSAFVGKWKVNLAKSSAIQWDDGKLIKKSEITDSTITVAVAGDTTTVHGSGTTSGQSGSFAFTVPTAGGPVNYTESGPPPGITDTMKVLDPLTSDYISTQNGKVVLTTRAAVSKNHKSMTLTRTGADEKGKAFKTVEVFDLQ